LISAGKGEEEEEEEEQRERGENIPRTLMKND